MHRPADREFAVEGCSIKFRRTAGQDGRDGEFAANGSSIYDQVGRRGGGV
jgi:hypothetical protein